MNQNFLWRAIVIAVVILGAALSAYPPGEKINLGLDLQGGMHLVLEVQIQDAIIAETDQDMQDLQRLTEDEEGLAGMTFEGVDDDAFQVGGVAGRGDQLRNLIDDKLGWRQSASPMWSMASAGGGYRFEMTANNRSTIAEQAVTQAMQTIRNRIDAFGVAEPLIARQGFSGNRIVVQLPGVDDPERVRDLIKSTSFLEFRLVDEAAGAGRFDTETDLLAAYGGTLPPGVEIYPTDVVDASGRTIDQDFYSLEATRVITGRDLKNARAGAGQLGDPVVEFYLSPEGARKFGQTTGESVGRYLAVVLDGKVQTAPVIESRITDSGIIRGQYTQQEVQDLVITLRSGALPAGIEFLEERTVGPSLGQDSIDQGVRAGLLGLGLVIVLMLVVYKLAGINAVSALLLNIVLVFGVLAAAGATLTLPGIAGIVLTVGMAVDANVLVFERIKEELATGRSVRAAIESGFRKALSSILDANFTTLIAALFLYQFGTGPIRGFAVTLSIGIVASVFTAVFVSRFLFDLIYNRKGSQAEKISI